MARERSKNQEENQTIETGRRYPVSGLGAWPVWSPFSMMRRFANEMDRMFEGFGVPTTERFAPEVDIFERDGKLVISADLPGLTKDDVKVDITEDAVILEGERKFEREEHKEGVYKTERGYGHFHRVIPLPEGVKTDSATANFKNGVLEITVDAPQGSKNRRRIQVHGGDPGGKPGQTAA